MRQLNKGNKVGKLPKFIAWHKEQKRFFEVRSIDLFSGTVDELFAKHWANAVHNIDDIELLQVFNINEKQVKHGDIIKTMHGNLYLIDKDYFDLSIVSINSNIETQLNPYCCPEFEVIGNTYQNPELIN